MKTLALIAITAIISAAFASAITYSHTRAKWQDLGRETGIIQGKAQVMEELSAFAAKSAPPGAANYYLNVKASRLSVMRDGDAVRLYLEE